MQDETTLPAPSAIDLPAEASRDWHVVPSALAAALACSWVIDVSTGRPVCGWSVETWRSRPRLVE